MMAKTTTLAGPGAKIGMTLPRTYLTETETKMGTAVEVAPKLVVIHNFFRFSVLGPPLC